MRRRAFIGLVSGAVMWPLTARGQQSTLPVVGFLGGTSPSLYTTRLALGLTVPLSLLGRADEVIK